MSGRVESDPPPGRSTDALSQSVDLAFDETYDAVMAASLPIASTLLDPFVLPLGAVTKVRAVCVRVVDGASVQVLVSSAAGNDQAIPVSDLVLVRAQNDGDQLTAVKVVGTARIEYLIGGDE